MSRKKPVAVRTKVILPEKEMPLFEWWANVLTIVNEAHDESTGTIVLAKRGVEEFSYYEQVLEITTFRWETNKELAARLRRQERRKVSLEKKRQDALKKKAQEKEKRWELFQALKREFANNGSTG